MLFFSVNFQSPQKLFIVNQNLGKILASDLTFVKLEICSKFIRKEFFSNLRWRQLRDLWGFKNVLPLPT